MPARLSNGMFFSEILADNAGGNAFDTDGDGGANKADEFVEIQGLTNSALSLDGIELWSAKRGQLFQFGSGDTIAAGGTATVVGQYDGAEPAGFYDAGLPDNNSNQGFLEDGEASRFDTLYLVDTNTGEYIALSYGDPPQAQPLPVGFPGTNLVGSEQLNSNAPNGVPFVRDANGDLTEGGTPDPGTPGPICFTDGTGILTPAGEVPVEALRVGQMVMTLDNGPRPIRWIGAQELGAAELFAAPKIAPVLIKQGALGQSLPRHDLVVSPQHRMLLSSRIAQRVFGISEVFVPAIRLTCLRGIRQLSAADPVRYHHILLDGHEVLFANGAPAESLHLGPIALASLGDASQREIARLFPGRLAGQATGALARFAPAPRDVRDLLKRHRRNRQPVLQMQPQTRHQSVETVAGQARR